MLAWGMAKSSPQRTIAGGNNSQCKRQADVDCRAASDFRLNSNRAAQLFDVCFDNVHSHAASADLGNLIFQGEAWMEHQSQRFAVSYVCSLLGQG